MQDSTNDDIMVQGVTDENKTFDSNEFGRVLKFAIMLQDLIRESLKRYPAWDM